MLLLSRLLLTLEVLAVEVVRVVALEGRAIGRGVLALPEHLPFEVLEGYHHHRHVVEGLTVERVLQNALHGQPTLLVHVLRQFLIFVIHGYTIPHADAAVFV